MTQIVTNEGNDGELQPCFDLQAHLKKFKVPDNVYTLLQQESITVDELLTFRTSDLDGWCDEKQLKMIERRRFLNAVKALPNANANEAQIVFVGNEEKEQMSRFEEMENNVTNIINSIDEINEKKKLNVNEIIKEINNVCDEIEAVLKQVRKDLLVQVSIV